MKKGGARMKKKKKREERSFWKDGRIINPGALIRRIARKYEELEERKDR